MSVLDLKDARPLYEQIVERFKHLILCGALPEDEKRPTMLHTRGILSTTSLSLSPLSPLCARSILSVIPSILDLILQVFRHRNRRTDSQNRHHIHTIHKGFHESKTHARPLQFRFGRIKGFPCLFDIQDPLTKILHTDGQQIGRLLHFRQAGIGGRDA